MEDQYVEGDDPMSFPVMVRASDGDTCKTNTRSNTQVRERGGGGELSNMLMILDHLMYLI